MNDLSRPQRALFITSSLAHGGAERHAVTLMNRLADRGHECHAAYLKNQHALLDVVDLPPARVCCLDAHRYFDTGALQRLTTLLGDIRPTLLVAANEYSLLYATLARRRAGLAMPLVVTYHSTRPAGAKERAMMLFYRPLFWHATCAVFVCENQRRYWRRRGVVARQNEVIYNGVDTAVFDPDAAVGGSAVSRQTLGFSDDDFVIGIAAGLRPEKNHVQLVRAVRRLRDQGIPARALLIGDGATRGAVEQCAGGLGVSEHVVITGYRPDVRPYLSACDAAVLCSTTETFSLAAIEAMALRRPFVHSNVGGAPEMIYPGWNGYLFPVGDTNRFVTQLGMLADRKRAEAMGLNARQVVETRFSERTMVDRYELLFDDLCRRAAGKRRRAAPAHRDAADADGGSQKQHGDPPARQLPEGH